MSEQPKDGGSAFPMASDLTGHQPGMSLRDYIAAQAMAGIISGYVASGNKRDLDGGLTISFAAYRYADAMLEARGK